MNDPVDRQAVKEWLAKWSGYIDADTIARMQYSVVDIPSAQPTQNERVNSNNPLDCISRQAALDAFKVCVTIGRGNGKSVAFKLVNDYADIVRKRIEALPSAQPEIVRCKDCKWFMKEYGWDCIEFTICGVSPTHHPIRREEDFCSRAERRTDE